MGPTVCPKMLLTNLSPMLHKNPRTAHISPPITVFSPTTKVSEIKYKRQAPTISFTESKPVPL